MNFILFLLYTLLSSNISSFGFIIDLDLLPDILWFKKSYEPTQIHLAFGDTVSEVTVTWVTKSKTPISEVFYGTEKLNKVSTGIQTIFQDLGKARRKFYIHKVLLSDLKENTTYEYKCGSNLGWSHIHHFHTPFLNTSLTFNFAIYGDLGVDNGVAVPTLIKEVKENKYDTIFHIGDIAYDMYYDDGKVGDAFMKMIEPIAANVPYMTAVGNHEANYNFLHYRKRFSMPGNTEGMYYSINIGPIHFIIFSTEVYYNYCHAAALPQYKWLEKDLKEASSSENRTERPWIIVMGHRPMYCSTEDTDDCREITDLVRVGCLPDRKYGLEKLFRSYAVDIAMFGHEHTYERSFPLYDYKVYNGTSNNPYHNPMAMIHIISGAAGNCEKLDNFHYPPGNWSAFRSIDYSYTILKVYNKTHLHFDQISVDKNSTIDDHFWVSKDLGWTYPVN